MDTDNDWVEDVKRWCRAGGAGGAAAPRKSMSTMPADDDVAGFGYEAANPAVQARHWPDAASAIVAAPMRR